MNYVNEVTPLKEFVKAYSDNDIAAAIAEFKKKRISELTPASHSLNKAIITEWKSRYGNKPIPRVIPESEMVLQKGSSSSCKFIKHLL